MNYPEAVAWLYSTQGVGIKLGLDNIRHLLDLVGIPHRAEAPDSTPESTPHAARILHVAGTNGKGSVCAMLDAICRAAGLRTGLFTSPHLVTYRERIRLNGTMIPEEVVAAGLTHLRDATAAWEHPPTFFELTTALALRWFQQEGAEVIVLETGLGGRLDSTNAVTPAVSVLTPISLDHQQYLGDTLERIAAEKAGIIKPEVPVVSALQPAEAAQVIEATAARLGAPLQWATDPIPDRYVVALAGNHQRFNAALAIAALEAAAIPVSEADIERGLHEVVWPGRFQRIPRPIRPSRLSGNPLILDGAHNQAAAERLVQTWREVYGEEKAVIILGVLSDKDSAAVCQALGLIAKEFIVTPVANPRSCSTEALSRVIEKHAPGIPVACAASVKDALQQGESKFAPLLVTGSLFLIGETLALLEGHAPEFASVQ